MIIHVSLYSCFSVCAVMLRQVFVEFSSRLCVYSCKQHSMADHHAADNCTKPLLSWPCTERSPPSFPTSFPAQRWCLCAGTKATVCHKVFLSVCVWRELLGVCCWVQLKMFCSVRFLFCSYVSLILHFKLINVTQITFSRQSLVELWVIS